MNRQRHTDQAGYAERQPNSKSQERFVTSYRPSASRCRLADQLALGSKIHLGSCCCTGIPKNSIPFRLEDFRAHQLNYVHSL